MLRLLIADDEELVRRGLTALIQREAPDITIIGAAMDGCEALDVALLARPDVILTDIRMPGLSGLELIGSLRAVRPRPRCIILSGYDEFDYARRAIGLGVAGYLLKPVDPDELLELLRRTEQNIIAEQRDEEMRLQTDRLAAEHSLLRLLNGHPWDGAARHSFAGAPAWALLLVHLTAQASAATSRPNGEALDAFCTHGATNAVAVEDAYGYLCLLMPLARGDTTEVAATAAQVYARLREAGYMAAVTAARPCASLDGLSAVYHEAIEVAEYHDAGTVSGPLLSWEVLPRVGERWPIVPVARCETMLDAITRGAEPEASAEMRALIVEAREQLAPGARRTLWVELAVLLIHHTQQCGVRVDVLLKSRQDPCSLLLGACTPDRLESELVGLVSRAACACQALRDSKAPRGVIADLRQYIESHPAADLTITHLARRLHLNAKYLGELFKQATGEPLGEYIIRTRMKHACELLAESPLKVYTVAEKVGYGSPRHFATMFRAIIGMSPAEYRERYGQTALRVGGNGAV